MFASDKLSFSYEKYLNKYIFIISRDAQIILVLSVKFRDLLLLCDVLRIS